MKYSRTKRIVLLITLVLALGHMVTISPMTLAQVAVETLEVALPEVEALISGLTASLATRLNLSHSSQDFNDVLEQTYAPSSAQYPTTQELPQEKAGAQHQNVAIQKKAIEETPHIPLSLPYSIQHTESEVAHPTTTTSETEKKDAVVGIPNTAHLPQSEAIPEQKTQVTVKTLADLQLKRIAEQSARGQSSAYPTAYVQNLIQTDYEQAHPYQITHTENGTHIKTNDGRGHCSIGAAQRKEVPQTILYQEQQQLEAIANASVIYRSPETAAQYHHIVRSVFDVLTAMESKNLKERVRACLDMNSLHSTLPFHDQLVGTKQHLRKAYFNKHGQLKNFVINKSSSHMRKHVKHFIKNSPLARSFQEKLRQDSRLQNKGMKTKHQHLIRKHLGNKIAQNERNQVYKKLLEAGDTFDMHTVQLIKNQYPQDRIIQKLAQQYQNEYKAAMYDAHGIIKVCATDPLYKNLAISERNRIAKDPLYREAFNQKLLARKEIKDALQAQWNIPDSAAPIVHETLYKVLENIHGFFETITTATNTASDKEYSALIQAFYLPNGVMKEIARQVPEAQKMPFPSCITSQQNAGIRNKINYALCHRGGLVPHSHPAEARTTIDYLRAYLMSSDTQTRDLYKTLSSFAYNELHNAHEPALRIPNVATAYTNRQQRETHTNILTFLVETLHRQHDAAKLLSEESDNLQKLFEHYYDRINQAHQLNQTGKPNQALSLLAETLGISLPALDEKSIKKTIKNNVQKASALSKNNKQQQSPSKKNEINKMQLPQGPEWEPENKKNTQNIIDKIRKTLNSDHGFLDTMEKTDGHTLDKHVSKTNEELIKRAIKENVDAATSFTDKSTATRAIKENLRQNIHEIADWIADGTPERKIFDIIHKQTVGNGALNGQKHIVYNLTKSRLILARDATNELGFKILTSFPLV